MSDSPQFTHLNQAGEANMVDVANKAVTAREATATGLITMTQTTFDMLQSGTHKKGDVFAVARVAGIQAAKRTSDLIPLCHPLMLSKVKVDFEPETQAKREETKKEETGQEETEFGIRVFATAKLAGQTGVEMEALTAASVACLTLYDMCKAVDPAMVIGDIKLLTKSGGKHGQWQRETHLAGES